MRANVSDGMLLTIGMIVKNEEKTLRKCLDSLVPLLEAVPSELIIADTGSTDSTVEIARQYTDQVLFFEWINDFAAARNFVLDKANGKWFMYIDGDEWFENTDEIVDFFLSKKYKRYMSASYIQRNYEDDSGAEYADFFVSRMFCRLPGRRYVGAVHEMVDSVPPIMPLRSFVHHYGYVYEGTGPEPKSLRNIPLLLKCIENKEGSMAHHYYQLGREYVNARQIENALAAFDKAVEHLEGNKRNTTVYYGALHDKIRLLYAEERTEAAEQEAIRFLDDKNEFSSFIDVAYMMAETACRKGEYEKAIPAYENYFRLCGLLDDKKLSEVDRVTCFILYNGPKHRRVARLNLAFSFMKVERWEEALSTLDLLFPEESEFNDANKAQLLARERDCIQAIGCYERYGERYHALAQTGSDERLEMLKINIELLMFTSPEAYLAVAQAVAAAGEEDDPYAKLMRLRAERKTAPETAGDLLLTMLETAPPTAEYAELIYFALADGVSPEPFFLRVDSDTFQAYFERMARYSDLGNVVRDYYESASPAGTAHSLLWEISMLERVLLNVEPYAPENKATFKRFCVSLANYVQNIYSKSILEDEEITVLPKGHRFGYLAGRAFALIEQGEVVEGLRVMAEAGKTYPVMLPHVQQLSEDMRMDLEMEAMRSRLEQEERESLLQQVKDQIYALIEKGDTAAAQQALTEYEAVNPQDEEIFSLRLQMRLAGYCS